MCYICSACGTRGAASYQSEHACRHAGRTSLRSEARPHRASARRGFALLGQRLPGYVAAQRCSTAWWGASTACIRIAPPLAHTACTYDALHKGRHNTSPLCRRGPRHIHARACNACCCWVRLGLFQRLPPPTPHTTHGRCRCGAITRGLVMAGLAAQMRTPSPRCSKRTTGSR